MNTNTQNAKRYVVATFREAGLEARWTRNSKGAPIMVARDPSSPMRHQREKWWFVTDPMWRAMQAEGIRPAFGRFTLLGDVFSLAV